MNVKNQSKIIIAMRERYGEVITKSSPLIREQFDKRDQFSIANPRRIKEDVLMKKLTEMAEAAGLQDKDTSKGRTEAWKSRQRTSLFVMVSGVSIVAR